SKFIKQRYQTFYNDCKDYFDLEQNYLYKNIQLSNVKIEIINKFKELLNFDFFDNREVSFNSFSEGEKNLFLSNLEIYSKFQEGNKIILLDEIELFLHPQWQKQYINSLLQLFEFNHIHFIFVTHSPFLLSDLPKKNIIFLDKVDENTKDKYPSINIEKLEKGNCLNVSKFININPFGANIHTLLSHGFFMKDGLMGEFAKNKISKILKFLSEENKFIDLEVKILPPLKIQNNFFEKNLKPIIEFIGEEFLKEKLLKMYEIKFPKCNEAKIKELENEIKRLKNASN
ncbi:AAA family ATPase, partial [Malaciobacter marinus]